MSWKNHTIIRKIFVLLGLLFLVTACSRGNAPVCIYADDFGDVISRSFEMEAAGVPISSTYEARGWVDTGIDVEAKRSLQISSQGSVEFCPRVSETVTVTVPANKSGWLPTNIYLNQMFKWQVVSIEGGYYSKCKMRIPSYTETPTTPDYGEAICDDASGNPVQVDFSKDIQPTTPLTTLAEFNGGNNLYAYVGDEPAEDWFGEPMSGTNNKAGYFFGELNRNFITNYDTNGNLLVTQAMYDESAPEYQGRLYLRLKDTSKNPEKWDEAKDYDNNVGAYKVTISYIKMCLGARGEFMQASIGQTPGIAGTVKDMTRYAKGIDGQKAGVFNDYAWATGRLWLRLLEDSNKKDWIGYEGSTIGDGDFTPRPSEAEVNKPSNYGKYYVDVVASQPINNTFSDAINKIIDPVKSLIKGNPESNNPEDYGLTKRLYLGLTGNVDYIGAVKAMLQLSIFFFALAYMLGITDVNSGAFITYLIKIVVVLVLISDQSWTFFYENLFRIFIDGMDELIWIMSGQFADMIKVTDSFADIDKLFVAATSAEFSTITDGIPVVLNGQEGVLRGDEAQVIKKWFIPTTDPLFTEALGNGGMPITMAGNNGVLADGVLYNPNTLQTSYGQEVHKDAFASLNQTLSRFFSAETNIKIAALMWSFPLGLFYIAFIYMGIFYFVIGILRALLMYLVSMIVVSLLLFLAPIFITFILFSILKSTFDTYIKILAGMVLQPVFMFMVLSLFNIFIYSIFYVLLYYDVCWSCVWNIDLPFNDWFGVEENFDVLCLFEGYRPWGISGNQEVGAQLNKMPISIFNLLIFIILTSGFNVFLDWASDIAAQLASGASSPKLSAVTKSIVSGALNTVGSTAKAGYAASGAKLGVELGGKAKKAFAQRKEGQKKKAEENKKKNSGTEK